MVIPESAHFHISFFHSNSKDLYTNLLVKYHPPTGFVFPPPPMFSEWSCAIVCWVYLCSMSSTFEFLCRSKLLNMSKIINTINSRHMFSPNPFPI